MKKRHTDKKKNISRVTALTTNDKNVKSFVKCSYIPYITYGIGVLVIGISYLASTFFQYSDFTASRKVFAASSETLVTKCQSVPCSKDYADHPVFSGCTPKKYCGRCVKDGLLSEEEVELLKHLAEGGLAYGGSSGGASILDLHSGALSKGEKFVNIYKYVAKEHLVKTFNQNSISTYIGLKNKIHQAIANHFNIEPSSLYLTKPTFFSRMTSCPAKTQHDEYWHKHIDKIQYGSFDYTALVYLTTHGEDFNGGRFVFDDMNYNVSIEPKKGRVSFFTSGSENPHHVEKVVSGTRYALTIAFTCDPNHAIKDPSFHL